MSKPCRRVRYASVVMLALFGWTLPWPVLAGGITGTYSGTYRSLQGSDDSGTVTITIDAYGAVSCDFYSTAKKTHYIASGSANAGPSATTVSFSTPGQPPGPPVALTSTSINCVAGPRINSGGTYDPAPTSSTFFAAQIGYLWAPSIGIAAYQPGTWISNSGSAGQFSVSFPAGIAANAPINPEALTGLWYDATYTGSGFNITASTAGLIVTYYGWDAAGQRLWLTSDIGPSQIVLGQAITLNLSHTVNGNFAAPAPPSSATPWGSMTLTFTSCTAATATLHGTDGDSTQSLTLLVGLNGLGCQ
jgi:hypothetical protein